MEEDNRIKITIQVAQRPMTIVIAKEWEHYFREAEKVINDSFLEFAKKWTYKDQQDLMSKILVDFVVKWLADEQRVREYEEEIEPMMDSLKTLTDKFEVDESFFDNTPSRISSDTFVKLNTFTDGGDARSPRTGPNPKGWLYALGRSKPDGTSDHII